MIKEIHTHHDQVVADFWVQAWQAVFPDIDFEARRPWLLDHLAVMRHGGQMARAYFEQDAPLGFYTLFPDTGLIEQICVSPSATGRGIGAKLMADAASQTDHLLNLVVNEDNQTARQFYAKLGFVAVGQSVNPTSWHPTITLQMTAKTTS